MRSLKAYFRKSKNSFLEDWTKFSVRTQVLEQEVEFGEPFQWTTPANCCAYTLKIQRENQPPNPFFPIKLNGQNFNILLDFGFGNLNGLHNFHNGEPYVQKSDEIKFVQSLDGVVRVQIIYSVVIEKNT